MAALLTIASSGPTSLRHRATESSLVTSSTCGWMPSDPLNADTSVATTECPRLASTCAVAIPMPRGAPVIKTLSVFDIRKSSCMSQLVFYGLFASSAQIYDMDQPRPTLAVHLRATDGGSAPF